MLHQSRKNYDAFELCRLPYLVRLDAAEFLDHFNAWSLDTVMRAIVDDEGGSRHCAAKTVESQLAGRLEDSVSDGGAGDLGSWFGSGVEALAASRLGQRGQSVRCALPWPHPFFKVGCLLYDNLLSVTVSVFFCRADASGGSYRTHLTVSQMQYGGVAPVPNWFGIDLSRCANKCIMALTVHAT